MGASPKVLQSHQTVRDSSGARWETVMTMVDGSVSAMAVTHLVRLMRLTPCS